MTAINHLRVTAKVNWALLPIMCIIISFCYLDRSNIAYMQLQLAQPPPVGLNFTDVVYGNGSGLFFIGYSVAQIPSNLILVCPTIKMILYPVCVRQAYALQ
jgi:MFS transporter, ACS family, tartrate transporter